MLTILNLTKTNKLILAAFAFLAVIAFGTGRVHAATLNVSGGCTLEEAITSLNNATSEPGCSPSGSYGTSDTITIPAGTQTLTNDLPSITVPAKVQGAGMSQTIISGDVGQYSTLKASGVSIDIENLKITGYKTAAISTQDCNVILKNIEVDGQDVNAAGSVLFGIRLSSSASSTKAIDADGIYIHNFNVNAPQGINVFFVQQYNGTVTNATLKNTTISDIHSTGGGGMNGMTMGVGMFGNSFGSTGTLNATIINTTIDNISSDRISGPFASVAFANGGNATVNTTVYNVTITNTDGITGDFAPVIGVKSGAFYAATAGLQSGNVGTANVSVGNSLMASNTTDGTESNNCSTVDISSGAGGAGTGVGTITSLGHNMTDDNSCTAFTQPTDKQNVHNIISTLGVLLNNGGFVPTRALLAGSPAISAGSAVLGVATDARGIARPSTCPSVGAFQFEGAVCAASTTNGGTNAAAPNTGILSVSLLSVAIATLLGLSAIGYSITAKRN